MSSVFSAVADVIEDTVDFVGDVVEDVVDVVEDVGEAVVDTVDAALEDPVRTIATIAAVATGNPQLIPYINAGATLAQGGDFEDALKSYAVSTVAQGVGQYVGDVAGTAAQYGTDPLSQQTAMLAAQSGDMLGGTFGGTVGGAAGAAAAGATAAALTGGDVDQAFINALGNYLVRTGVRYTVNEAGKLVDEFGNEAPPEVVNEIVADADEQLIQLSGPTEEAAPTITDNADGTFTQMFDDGSSITTDSTGNIIDTINTEGESIFDVPLETPEVGPTMVENLDGTITQTFDDGSTITTDAAGNVIDTTTTEGESVFVPGPISTLDPYEVDNVGTREEGDTLTGTTSTLDPYEVDNVGTRAEEDILTGTAPDLSNVTDAATNYFKNQFINQLTRQISGGLGLTPSAQGQGYRLPARTSIGLPSSLNIADLLPIGDFTKLPEGLYSDETRVPTEPIKLWSPGLPGDYTPRTKLTGLGFAGQYINPDDSDGYLSDIEKERARIEEEARTRGWMTEDERQSLEQLNPYFNVDDTNAIQDISPWFNPEYAQGGLVDHDPEFYSEGGASLANRYVKGDGDGTSDSVPAMLASGEFVIPADVVSGLGNGDNDAGAKVLDEFMKSVRQHKRSTDPASLPPDSKGALEYLKDAHKKVGKKHGRS